MITFKARKKCDYPQCPATIEVEVGISDAEVPILFEVSRAEEDWGHGYNFSGHRCPIHKV